MQPTIHNATLVSNVAQDNPGSLNMRNTLIAWGFVQGPPLKCMHSFLTPGSLSIVSILYMQFRGYVTNACNASWRAQVLDWFLSPLRFYLLYVMYWRRGFFFFQFYDASKQDDKWGQQLLISSLHEAHPGFYTWEQCHTTMQNFIKGRASPSVPPLARR